MLSASSGTTGGAAAALSGSGQIFGPSTAVAIDPNSALSGSGSLAATGSVGTTTPWAYSVWIMPSPWAASVQRSPWVASTQLSPWKAEVV